MIRSPAQIDDVTSESPRSVSGVAQKAFAWAVSPMARKGVAALVDQALVSGTSFLTSVIIGRLCTREDLGLYFLGLSLVLIARGVQDQLISTPYMVYGNRHRDAALAAYTGSTLIHQVGLALVVMLAFAGLALVLGHGLGPHGLAPVAWVLVAAIPWLLLRECTRQFAFAHLQIRSAIVLDMTVCLLQLGGLLALGLTHRLTVQSAYLVMAGACALSAGGWFLARQQPVRFSVARIVPDWRQNWSLARWALASLVVSSFTPYLSSWILANRPNGTNVTAMLAAAATLVGPAHMFLMGMASYLAPQSAAAYARGGSSELSRTLAKGALLQGLGIGLIALVLVVFGGPLLLAVYGPKYAGGGAIVAAVAGCALANGMGGLAGSGLWAMERPQANFVADLGALLVTLLASVLLIGRLDALGAALAMLAGALTGSLVRGLTVMRALSSKPLDPMANVG
jgi:O-antigen/teichoic acid export membrane protein